MFFTALYFPTNSHRKKNHVQNDFDVENLGNENFQVIMGIRTVGGSHDCGGS